MKRKISLGIAAVAMVYLYASMINWQNVNMDAFQSLQNIDQTDKTQVTEWVQQFFKMDISSYIN